MAIRRIEYQGEYLKVSEASARLGISMQTIRKRIRLGLDDVAILQVPTKPRRRIKNCPVCEAEFKARNSAMNSTGDGEQVYCSRACAFADTLPKYSVLKPCVMCGNLHGFARRVCCSRECDMERARQRYYENRPRPDARECKECQLLFSPAKSDGAMFCSDKCSKRHGDRVYKAKRRARMRGINYENVNPFKVFERDGWCCQLCGKLTPRIERGGMEHNAPELDHIVPLAVGGNHSYANTQCLCRACNGAKGDRTEDSLPNMHEAEPQGRGANCL